jgi:hypothetical protein
MRAVLGILSLLMVLAVVGSLAKKQLGFGVKPIDQAGAVLPASAPGATPQQQSQQIQQQVKQSIEAAMQQGRPVPDDK